MRLHHIAFVSALICGAFAWAGPMSWPNHLLLCVATIVAVFFGLILATGSKVLDVIHPRREDRRNQKMMERAFKAGRDSGLGPSEATLARWRREGFGYPGPRR